MLAFSQLDERQYDEAAVQISYCKLFPLILEDFASRLDCIAMMNPSNLPFQSTVTVTPGQAVQVVVPAGAGSTVSPATGSGVGQVVPPFNASQPHPSTNSLKLEKVSIKESGGVAIDSALTAATGG